MSLFLRNSLLKIIKNQLSSLFNIRLSSIYQIVMSIFIEDNLQMLINQGLIWFMELSEEAINIEGRKESKLKN